MVKDSYQRRQKGIVNRDVVAMPVDLRTFPTSGTADLRWLKLGFELLLGKPCPEEANVKWDVPWFAEHKAIIVFKVAVFGVNVVTACLH